MANQIWQVDIHKAAANVIMPIPQQWRREIYKLFGELQRGMHPQNSVKVAEIENTFSVTIEGYRIVYQVQEEKSRIKIAMIDLTF